MQIKRDTKRILRITGVLVIALAAVAMALGWIERERNKDEEYAVYSAYLSDGILNEPHDWSTGPSVQVVIRDRTAPAGNLRFRLFSLVDQRLRFTGLSTLTPMSYITRNLFQTHIQPKFMLPRRATLCLTRETEPYLSEFQRKFPRNIGLVVLSGVGFNPSQSQAVFYIDHFCGLCGGGRYVLMEKVSGVWRIREEHYKWIS